MKIIENYLSINEYSRPGRSLKEVKGVIMHYVGVPGQRALTTWNFFQTACPRDKHYSSAHYIIDLNGGIYHAVPDNEIAYHCGSSQIDPKSGRFYTDWARGKFGRYAAEPELNSPNNCTLGVELCVLDAEGNFTNETLKAAAELAANLIKNANLTVNDLGTHNLVVGWKNCPLLWVKNPILFYEFKERVGSFLEAG